MSQSMSSKGGARSTTCAAYAGIHADLDQATEEQLQKLHEILPPTIVVQSSSKSKQHWYWLLVESEEVNADTAKVLNQGLVRLGADKAAVDVTRLLRLPGFRHMKRFEKGDGNA
ncbi:RepB family DNA primase [Rhodobacteraceae bacterium]|nr:RepB family DNA primase [Paracoccaceae bacterium]